MYLIQLEEQKMPSLRLGSIAPDFEAVTTQGPIRFHDWIGDSWVRARFWVFDLDLKSLTHERPPGHLVLSPSGFHPCMHNRTRRSRPSRTRLCEAQRQSNRNFCEQTGRSQ